MHNYCRKNYVLSQSRRLNIENKNAKIKEPYRRVLCIHANISGVTRSNMYGITDLNYQNRVHCHLFSTFIVKWTCLQFLSHSIFLFLLFTVLRNAWLMIEWNSRASPKVCMQDTGLTIRCHVKKACALLLFT